MKKFILLLFVIFTTSFFASAEVTPASYPGGKEAMDKYISDNLKYPTPSKENGIEGIVYVAFTVKTDGTIGSIKIVRMIDPDLEQEAIRLVKGMPAWIPASDSGTPVDSRVEISVPFLLE